MFLEDWYSIWRDERGARRRPAEAQARYERWQTDPGYATLPALRKLQRQIDAEQFVRLSQFLRQPTWEATNNGAERGGRMFRHRQRPHFNLRSGMAIEQTLIAVACLRKRAATDQRAQAAARCAHGRPRRPPRIGVAA